MFKGFWSKSFMLAGKTVSVKVAALAAVGVVTVGGFFGEIGRFFKGALGWIPLFK